MEYEDDTNDCGLRKTQYSSIIYCENPGGATKPAEKPAEKSVSRQGSVEKDPEITRSRKNSAERTQPDSPARKISVASKKIPKSANNTWNGRQKGARPSLTAETFSNPFTRCSPTRRSVSTGMYDHHGGRRLSHSAATSPTKGSLKEELMEAVKNAEDNETIVKEVEKLLRQYGSMNMLNEKEKYEEKVGRKRKDSKPENTVTRIPAPIFNRV